MAQAADFFVSYTSLEQKAAANRQVIAILRQRLATGEQVARMYQEPGLAWLERQAGVAEDLVADRQAAAKRHRCWLGLSLVRNDLGTELV